MHQVSTTTLLPRSIIKRLLALLQCISFPSFVNCLVWVKKENSNRKMCMVIRAHIVSTQYGIIHDCFFYIIRVIGTRGERKLSTAGPGITKFDNISCFIGRFAGKPFLQIKVSASSKETLRAFCQAVWRTDLSIFHLWHIQARAPCISVNLCLRWCQ
jgi:hypothetical protein